MTRHYERGCAGATEVGIGWQRLYGDAHKPAPWLVGISLNARATAAGAAHPIARAVVDDFGNLVLVEAWH